MKHIILLYIVGFMHLNVFCQCPNYQNSLFTTQEQIDNFSINYPNCTGGSDVSVRLQGSSISNLNGFSQLTSLSSLQILDNDLLNDLTGLNNITEIGWIAIENCDNLLNLNGLNNLQVIDNFLRIENNNSLNNLTGLDNLEFINNFITIENNNSLNDLTGLDNLTEISWISIKYCDNLQNFNGLNNLEFIDNAIWIENNNSLIDLTGLNNITEIGSIEIKNCDNLLNLNGLNNLGVIGNALRIENNNSLNSLTALSSVTIFGIDWMDNFLIFHNNPNLVSLDGLENFEFIEEINNSFWIELSNNPNLSYCSKPNICELLNVPIVYSVVENNSPGCNSQNEIVEICQNLSISEEQFNNIKIYPNPTNSDIYVEEISNWEDFKISIYNNVGTEFHYEMDDGKINIESLHSGVYFLIINCDNNIITKKIVKN